MLATIFLDACITNCKLLKRHADNRKLFAVVKADAFGHGMIPVATAIANEVDGFCVFSWDEAVELASAKLAKPILAMAGFNDSTEMESLAKIKAWPVIAADYQIEMLKASKVQFERSFIKVNSGMNRLGFSPDQAIEQVRVLKNIKQAGDLALMTHFASADTIEECQPQVVQFAKVIAELKLPFTCSNTAATLLDSQPIVGEEFVRSGIGVYGCSPKPQLATAASLGLIPAMELTAPIVQVRRLKVGDRLGYGGIWQATKPVVEAVIKIGYADGYPRTIGDGAPVKIGNLRAELAGRVAMDMISVVMDDSDCKINDLAQLWGRELPADEVAAYGNTIGYELVTGLSYRVVRHYKHNI